MTTVQAIRWPEIISQLTQPIPGRVRHRTCLAHALRGHVLWSVWEDCDQKTGRVTRVIGCDVVIRSADGGWTYENTDESMGPYYYSCPLKYLEMVPEVQNEAWRDGVKHYHRNLKLSFQVALGQTIRVVNKPFTYGTLVSKKPLMVRDDQGRLWRIKRADIESITSDTHQDPSLS